ncbi:tRNA (adenine-N1)-methyltransferase [Candidatus Bathyarchaeota archaeon]|nr:tRNA (adenine-N1)-methyltransferase [Candidatus Bathyarchaeota archaeon]MBS7618699.1 tRNA (adenine-N1)-methyltransferase [Candidatus Bathyarchaeota archaeon]
MDVVNEGDYILLYLDGRRSFLVEATDRVFHTHRGYLKLKELIGQPYGSQVKSSIGVEFTLLKPALRDFILKKFRRPTQIVYPKDAGLILTYTGIGPGFRIAEAGVGSGALTAFLAYYVRPTGRVYGYEIRSDLIKIAKRNLSQTGLMDYIELKLKDVREGFDERDLDAVVLDLPTPWEVIPKAYDALKNSGVFVSFSPTINQVEKTVETARAYGFVSIEAVECLERHFKVKAGETRPETVMIGHTGYLVFARKSLKST